MTKKLTQAQNKFARELKKVKKGIGPNAVLVGDEIRTDSGRAVPAAVEKVLHTTLSYVEKSTTQYVTNDSDHHIKMNLKTFIEQNAAVLQKSNTRRSR